MSSKPQSFTITGTLPGMNELIAADRTSRFDGARLKKATDLMVALYAKGCGVVPVTGARIHVDIEWIEPNKRRDPDNIAAGKKFVLDGLRKARIINGDGHKQIAGFSDTFSFDPDHPRVVVTLTEV